MAFYRKNDALTNHKLQKFNGSLKITDQVSDSLAKNIMVNGNAEFLGRSDENLKFNGIIVVNGFLETSNAIFTELEINGNSIINTSTIDKCFINGNLKQLNNSTIGTLTLVTFDKTVNISNSKVQHLIIMSYAAKRPILLLDNSHIEGSIKFLDENKKSIDGEIVMNNSSTVFGGAGGSKSSHP